MTSVVEQNPSPAEKKRWSRTRGPLGEDVARTVARLQHRLLAAPPDPNAIAALAKLRRGIGQEPGFDYTLESHLGVPDELLGKAHKPDEATDAEHAKHAAVTLYALHQQSQRSPMHVDGRGLGQAIRELVNASALQDGVRRRFAALGTAISFDESLYHLRSLITMLQKQAIPLDYGLLAHDLAELRKPGGRARMQAVWGREFFRTGRFMDVEDNGNDNAANDNAANDNAANDNAADDDNGNGNAAND